MARLGIITGMFFEAATLSGGAPGGRLPVSCSGPGPLRAATATRHLLEEGCDALLCAGLSGGLDPALAAGDLVIADAVVGPGGQRYATDAEWVRRLQQRLQSWRGIHYASVATVDRPVCAVDAKRDLALRSGAVAVDMESAAVAQLAAEAGIPFLAIRAISDRAGHRVPAWAADLAGEDGMIRLGAAFSGMLTHPLDLPAYWAIANGGRKGLKTLRRVAAGAGPGFGYS